jgi:glycosyltransferase involved in cell wall biosynthesis
MRIAYITPRYAPFLGGVERHVQELAERVAGAGHEVEVLTPDRPGHAPAEERLGDVLVRRFAMRPASDTYPVAPGLFAWVRRHGGRYDVVHAHSYHALPALSLLLLRHRRTVLTPHYHGRGHTPAANAMHRVYRPAGKALVRRSRVLICVSDAEARLVRRDFPGSAARVHVIPNGVDVARFHDAEPFADRRKVVLAVSRLEPYKRVDRIVEAVALLEPEFVLRIVGSGPGAEALQTRARALGLNGRVELVGRVSDEDLPRWYRTAAVYVSMSEQEAFGLTLIEATAAGAPVVASDIPAHREVRDLGAAATLVPHDASPQELAATIRSAANGPRGEAASALPTWDAVARQTLQVYETSLFAPGA